MSLKGKKILLGASGSVAVYKAISLARELIRQGSELKVILTNNAKKFVTPLQFESALNNLQVFDDMFESENDIFPHINLTKWADCLLIAPATANIIAKSASGIADDLLSTAILAMEKPVIFVPAMNSAMFTNRITQRNIEILKEFGYYVMTAETGKLACGDIGIGKMPDIKNIVEFIEPILSKQGMLSGKKILVTAGPTREFIDSVRFLSNPSSGKMGFAIADVARQMGADVCLIHGPVQIPIPKGVEAIPVISAKELYNEVMKRFHKFDCIIMSSAVSDYTPKTKISKKLKKSNREMILKLAPTIDILAEVGKKKRKEQKVIGFAIETENIVENAKKKLLQKKLDIIVANPIGENCGFESDYNNGYLIFRNGMIDEIENMPKYRFARIILEKIAEMFK